MHIQFAIVESPHPLIEPDHAPDLAVEVDPPGRSERVYHLLILQ